jgi:hypothetical protein
MNKDKLYLIIGLVIFLIVYGLLGTADMMNGCI